MRIELILPERYTAAFLQYSTVYKTTPDALAARAVMELLRKEGRSFVDAEEPKT